MHPGESQMYVEPGLVGELGLLWQGRHVGFDLGWGLGVGSYLRQDEAKKGPMMGTGPKDTVAADALHREVELLNGPTLGLRLGADGLARVAARALSTGPDDHNVMLTAGVEIPLKNFSR
jgi:hypothetical protein